jgi:hypothetical protein
VNNIFSCLIAALPRWALRGENILIRRGSATKLDTF